MARRLTMIDDRLVERYKIHFNMHIEDVRILFSILKKIKRMTEVSGQVIPDFNEGEMEIVEELWSLIKNSMVMK